MDRGTRFFVSFSSRDLKYVREIMAAMDGQGIDFWNYADELQGIELGEKIDHRLIAEIETCTHIILVISKNTMDPEIGRFCRFEMEYVRKNAFEGSPKLIPVLLDKKTNLKLEFPYDYFENDFCYELDDSSESIVNLTVKICKLAGKIYIPPIEAHPSLPFWKFFRKEVEEFAQSNKDHVDLMMILGEFNEYYKKSSIERSLFLIGYFIQSCKYRVPGYQPFYPIIVQAVCETELGKYDDAMISYEQARIINPGNQDVIGGIGTIYFKTGDYKNAEKCFEKIILNPDNPDVTNARINLAICRLSMNKAISATEADFLFQVDISTYSHDIKTAILNARGVYLLTGKRFEALEQLCIKIIADELHDAITYRLLQLSYFNRGMKEKGCETIQKAIKEAAKNSRLDKNALNNYLKDC
jgi:tetratricopeptide (TPR) repeat protein